MTWPDDERDARLSELLSDSVSDVEPGNALDSIRNRTKVTPMSARRPWLFAVGGAVVATAAVVTAVALAGGNLAGEDDDPGPVAQSTKGTKSPKPTGSDSPTEPPPSSTPPQGGTAVPVYFVSEQPRGLRLFREFHASAGGDPLVESARASVEGAALDPDYRSLWPEGSSVASATSDGADILTVDVTGAPHDLPSGMSPEDAQLAIQQVVYSVQAAHGQGRVGVQLLLDGERSDQVLGQPTSEPLANAPLLETVSMMQINYPNEGDVVSGSFTAAGANNSFEATVTWKLLDGDQVVAEGFGMATGWGEDKLFPWEVEVDVSGLAPGAYTFVAANDDPSGGAEGAGPDSDTRTIIVE